MYGTYGIQAVTVTVKREKPSRAESVVTVALPMLDMYLRLKWKYTSSRIPRFN